MRVAGAARSSAPRHRAVGGHRRRRARGRGTCCAAAGTDIDLVARGLSAHGVCASGQVAGVPARVFRISFTGELSYEVNVPAGYGGALWEALWQAGQPFGITPYGTEAMHVLRGEKGYIIVGQETDGTVTPARSRHGLDRQPAEGRLHRQARRSPAPTSCAPDRKQLVGLLTEDPAVVLRRARRSSRTRSSRSRCGCSATSPRAI